jgi:mRNA interferase RelE/StbE
MGQTPKTFSVRLKPAARKWLQGSERSTRQRIAVALVRLSHDPRPAAAKKLVNEDNFRLRVGDYRIIYEVRDQELLVLVVRIGHRREIYRYL